MKYAPIPENETQRLDALKKLNLLDTPLEERFERITKFACRLFDVPISTISLIDSNREWFKSCQGMLNREGARDVSFCGHAVSESGLFIIPDARKDERFQDNPMVTGKPFIRFYAGQSLKGPDGYNVGVFCIKDQKPKQMTDLEILNLKDLAAWVELELNSCQLSILSIELDQAMQSLKQQYEELERINNVLINRELRMVELKKEVNDLCGMSGKEFRYQI